MPIEVTMAKLSPTMESGQLVRWLVKVGDPVKEGDALAEVQTDKAVMPMESFEEGVVARLDAKEGDDIAVGQRILVLAAKGEDPKQVGQGGSGAKAKTKSAANEPKVEPATPSDASKGEPEANAQPETEEVEPSDAKAVSRDGGRVKASPLARKIAEEASLDLSDIRGTGPSGRVVREDVEAALRGQSRAKPKPAPSPAAKSAPAAEPKPKPAPTPAARGAAPEGKRIPHSPMRKTIAKRMVLASQTVPAIHFTADIRMDQVAAMRERLNQSLQAQDVKLSISDFVTKAVGMALRRHPQLNASFEDDAIVVHDEANVGIAVALENGLIVPVLHHADQLGLREIRQGTQALTEAARQNKLTTKQLTGSTFTISNLGMYGIKAFDAILNLPEVGILAVGASEARPVVDNGQLGVGQVMTATLTVDHRAVDGATAAEFMRTLKGLLEEPASMLL